MRAKTLFLLKFLLLVSLLLPLWLIGAAGPYLQWLGQESAVVLRALGYTVLAVGVERGTHVKFQVDLQNAVSFEAILATLNIIMYVGLVLSSVGVRWVRRLGYLLAGLLVLNVFQVAYVVAHFYVNFHYEPNSTMAQGLRSVSEIVYLLLPVLLWALFEAPRLFPRLRRPPPAVPAADESPASG